MVDPREMTEEEAARVLASTVARNGLVREDLYTTEARTPDTWSEAKPFRPAGGVDLAETVALAEREAQSIQPNGQARGTAYFEFNDARIGFDTTTGRFSARGWVRQPGYTNIPLSTYEGAANAAYQQLLRERQNPRRSSR